jgi:hypothetical protein
VRDMAEVAQRLRLVRGARRKFLRLWAVDQAILEPLLERVERDLQTAGSSQDRCSSAPGPLPPPPHPADKPTGAACEPAD